MLSFNFLLMRPNRPWRYCSKSQTKPEPLLRFKTVYFLNYNYIHQKCPIFPLRFSLLLLNIPPLPWKKRTPLLWPANRSPGWQIIHHWYLIKLQVYYEELWILQWWYSIHHDANLTADTQCLQILCLFTVSETRN